MKREFRKGDVIVRIGTMDKLWVYAVDDEFYYATNLRTGTPGVWTIPDNDLVKLGRMDEEEAHNLANQARMALNFQYGFIGSMPIPLA